jgi:tetratricopeptide (TPR) repeat protein
MYVFEIVRTNLSYRQDPALFSSSHTESSLQGGYFYTSWKILGEWIDRQVPAGSILASPDKEIAPFAAKHKFLELNRAVTLPTFEALLRDNTVEYLLAPTVYDSLVEYQSMIDESKRFRFVRIHRLNRTNIYRIESRFEEPIHDSRISQSSLDINNPSHAFRIGRTAVLQEDYADAISIFSQLHDGSPYRTDILYQLLIAQTFALDSLGAVKNLQNLYVSPNSASYTAPAQAYIYAMNIRLHAQYINDPVSRADQLYELGRYYWKLGYSLQAYHMMQQAVKIDPDYFTGYLWAWHYGLQTGDTVHVKQYLDRLVFIDRDNPVVKSFIKMSVSQDSLRRTGDRQKRSMQYLALSHEYHEIALPDEALDEAQHAVGENPNNAEAWHYLASLFEERKSVLAVRRAVQKVSEIENRQALKPGTPQ